MPTPPGARFRDPAELYDLVHHAKDYASDAARIADILDACGIPHGARLLEGACGTGSYLARLALHYAVTGFDLSPRMLAVARARLPEVPLFRADLASFEVEEPFDVVIVLFGGIAYVPPDGLAGAARAIAAALAPGGVAIVEPWLGPDQFLPDQPQMVVFDTRFLKVCRQVVPRRDGDVAVLDFHFLVARPGLPVEHVVDENRLHLYEPEVVTAALEEAGLRLERWEGGLMEGTRLLVCRKTTPAGSAR